MAIAPPDYVLVGHVALDYVATDRVGQEDSATAHSQHQAVQSRPAPRFGGTALYAGVAAQRLGRRVGLVTALSSDVDFSSELDDVALARVFSETTTKFSISLSAGGERRLRLMDRASDVRLEDVPESWRGAPILHLAPLTGEVDPGIAGSLSGPWVGATVQGWLRRCEIGKQVRPILDVDAWPSLTGLDVAVCSLEDLTDESSADPGSAWRRAESLALRVPVLALTEGPMGCTVFDRGRAEHVAAWEADERDSTGAGDVFAASFFVRLSETEDPLESARFASCAAALSVEGVGISRIPTRDQVQRVMRARSFARDVS